MKRYVVIVAGGKGTRMGADVPKQFLPIGGRPVLMRTMERFHAFDADIRLVVVLPAEQQDYWRALCERYQFDLPHALATGGATRFDSSRHGLALIPDDEAALVAVHDGARPLSLSRRSAAALPRQKRWEVPSPSFPSRTRSDAERKGRGVRP